MPKTSCTVMPTLDEGVARHLFDNVVVKVG